MQKGLKITFILVPTLFGTFSIYQIWSSSSLSTLSFYVTSLLFSRSIAITKLVASAKYPLIKEKLVLVRLMLRKGHIYANESPSLCMVTTWSFSYILHTSYRDPWWRQEKSRYQWSTASARGKRGPSLAGTLVTPAGHPGTGDWRSAAVIQVPLEMPPENL